MDVMPDLELSEEDGSPTVVETVESDQDELVARAREWDAALLARDEPAMHPLLAPDFALELVQPVRSVMKRDVWLEVLPDYVVHEWEVEEQIVDLQGDVGALLQRVRMSATVMGEDRSGVFILTDIWVRVDGQWQVWRRHSTPFSAGRLPA